MDTLSWLGILLLLIAIIVNVVVRYDDSPKFKYRFKFCFYVFTASFISLLCIPFLIFRPKRPENLKLVSPIVKYVSKLLGVKWEVHGLELLTLDFPCVVVSNHQSILDVLGMAEIWPAMRICKTVSKKELFYVFPFGIFAWLCGNLFIDRSRGAKSQMKLKKMAETLKETKSKVWIFPEGTRHKGSELLPFKKGAFHIAIQCKIPIVPVVISPYTFINDEAETFGHGKVVMSVLDLIQTTDVTDVNELTEKTRDIMGIEFERLTNYVNSPSAIYEERLMTLTEDTITKTETSNDKPLTYGKVNKSL